jgi:CRISPR type II-A-associated protein Csn2
MIFKIFGFNDIEFSTENNTVLVIENHKLFSKTMINLLNYTENNQVNDEIIFIDNKDHIVKGKNIILVLNPLQINFNSKTIINKIYTMIQNSIINQQDIYENFNFNITKLNNIILNELNDYNFDFNVNFDVGITAYLKCLDVKIDVEGLTVFDRLINFIELVSQILSDNIILFVGLLQYLNDEEINELNKYICYKKVNCLYIENNFNRNIILKKYVIDEDFYDQLY